MPTNEFSEYVLGFLFVAGCSKVVLIRKDHPDWQRGKLNGLGGKIEPGESPAQAMEREFFEESGKRVTNWRAFVTMEFPAATVFCFAAEGDTLGIHSPTDEWVDIFQVHTLPPHVIPNLPWLIPLALANYFSVPVIRFNDFV